MSPDRRPSTLRQVIGTEVKGLFGAAIFTGLIAGGIYTVRNMGGNIDADSLRGTLESVARLGNIADVLSFGAEATANTFSGAANSIGTEGLRLKLDALNNPVTWGAATGVIQNIILRRRMLNYLTHTDEAHPNPKIHPGTYEPNFVEDDGTKVFKITCVDAGRLDKNGLAIPGGLNRFGGPFTSIATGVGMGAVAEGWFGKGIGGPMNELFVGLGVGSNALSFIEDHIQLATGIGKVLAANEGKVRFELEGHLWGCGAMGFADLVNHVAKLKHVSVIADLRSYGDAIAAYAYVNTVLNPLVSILSFGRATLSASAGFSDMDRAEEPIFFA